MKNIFILATLLAVTGSTTLQAQDLPEAGSFSTEIQFNPLDEDANSFSLEGLKFRYFINEKNALRFGIGLGMDNSKYSLKKELSDEETPESITEQEYKAQKFDLNIRLGYERHFPIGKRADLYVGGEMGISKRFAKTVIEETSYARVTTESELKNAYLPNEVLESMGNNVALSDIPEDNRAHLGFNVTAFTGIDFYLYKGLFIGAEMGLGVDTYSTNKPELTVGDNSSKVTTSSDSKYYRTKINIEPHISLGWTF